MKPGHSRLADRVIDLAMQIQQIPAPTFAEGTRAAFVRGLFEREGLNVSTDDVGNVYGGLRLKSSGSKVDKPLIVSAHLDTVFPVETNLQIRHEEEKVYGPGMGDNSLGVAALFGLLWGLRERVPPLPKGDREAPRRGGWGEGEIWFVANVGEEGLGDLRGMKAVVDRFGGDVLAYLVLEGLALGHVYHRALGVKRYRITAKTPGGHSWSDYGKPSAVHELSKLVTELTAIKLPESPRTTMNVGRISGGTSVNVIASEAWLELDLRSEETESLVGLIESVENKIREAGRSDVTLEAEVIGERPAGDIDPNHLLIQLALECVREQGLEPSLTTGSTDANIPLSKGYPAVVLGITTGGGAHTVHEYINTEFVEKGLGQVMRFVELARQG